MPNENGVPPGLTVNLLRDWVEPRISAKRFKHVRGVTKVARQLATKLNCDPLLAEIAAWLHDCCKEMKATDLVDKAKLLGVQFTAIEELQGHLLHGPVAAATVRIELGITNNDVLSAIAEHTLGNAPMCPLSEVLYLADCLEEGRPKSYTAPIWGALDLEGSLDVARAIVVASDLGLIHLIESGRPIHPRTIEVRNYYMERTHSNISAGKA